MQEQIEQKGIEQRGRHQFIVHLPARFYERLHFIYICDCGYAEAVPAGGGPASALDGEFRPKPDAGGIAAHLDLIRAHEMN
ncbi:MAG: hypothetical protein ABSG46_17700 [Candidatus Binataceae bacterium]|jgi:hypothetical protein